MTRKFNEWLLSDTGEIPDTEQREEIIAKTIGMIRGSLMFRKYAKWKRKKNRCAYGDDRRWKPRVKITGSDW